MVRTCDAVTVDVDVDVDVDVGDDERVRCCSLW